MFGLGDKKDPPEQPAADEPPKTAEELDAELKQLEAEIHALEEKEAAEKAAADEPVPPAPQPDPQPQPGPASEPVAVVPVIPMRAPEDLSSVSHDGGEFVVPHDRICHVPVAAVEAFIGMGFVQVEE